ncbi:MAG: hypothetical protein OWU33_10770 [Firmicutes bacterium]|nr:hypothetical protein [Bacillota bacterium]
MTAVVVGGGVIGGAVALALSERGMQVRGRTSGIWGRNLADPGGHAVSPH